MTWQDDPRRHRRSRRPHKDARTIPLRGYGDDAGKWYRCWNCGWINKVGQNELGGAESKDGVSHVRTTTYSEGAPFGGERGAQATLEVVGGLFGTTLKSDSSGNGVAPVVVYDITSRGCGFCGSLNWRGDY